MSAVAAPAAATFPRAVRKPSPLQNLRTLLPYVWRYRRGSALGVATLLAGGLVGAMLPLVMGTIVDSISGAHALIERMSALPGPLERFLLSFYRPLSGETLVFFSLTLLGIVLVKGIFSFLTRNILIGVSRDIEYDLRNELLDHLLKMEPAFYVRNRTGELMSRCTNDLNAVRMVLGPGIMYSLNTIVIMVMAISIMVRISPRLTLYVFLPVPLVAVAVRYFGKIIHDRYEKIQALLAALSARVQENLTGMRVVRAFCQEEHEARAFGRQNKDYVDSNMELIAAWSMFFPALEFLIGIVFLIVLWQGSRLILMANFSIGALIAFYGYIAQLVWPMVALGWVTNIFQRGAASMGRLRHILTAEPEIDDRAAAVPATLDIRGEIEFRHLTFGHLGADGNSGARPVLDDISLKIPAGSTVAIVGPTGSGKSTMATLVARLWDAPPGSVLIDGRPIAEWPLATLRRAIGYVPQDTFLFSETLRENIAFGAESASNLDIDRAAHIASIREEILDFPKQYETLVGERGLTLSGGQKQRTALARALVRNPKILILDDALANVDTETEERILRGLAEVMRHRTTLLISHRCSTVRHADQIVVLREGRIVESGTHEDLIGRGGYYADLYQKQLLEEELARV
ncbi:MAG TPA: ABC transporter ATP-binding protein [Candidatus Acidoferrales bacterium]|nr:ABC transporter ATP-binding protein [Candidatus Acidoferrales bacterium]